MANFVPFGSPISNQSVTVSDLQPGTQYEFIVYAINESGSGQPSDSVIGTTSGNTGPALTVPGQVTNLQVTSITSNSANLLWDPPSSGGAPQSYRMQYKTLSESLYTDGPSINSSPGTITGLQASTSYNFRVYAVNSIGNGTPSAIASGTTASSGPPPVPAPGAIQNLIIVNNSSSYITIDWDPPLSDGNALRNGAAMSGGNDTSEMAYYNNTVYKKSTSTGNWSTWNGTAFTGPVTAPPTTTSTTTTPTTIKQLRDLLLTQLKDLSGKKTISTQHVGGRQNDTSGFNTINNIRNMSGHFVGGVSGGYFNDSGSDTVGGYEYHDLAIPYWNNGGLVILEMGTPNPAGTGNSVNASQLLTEGSSLSNSFYQIMDKIAAGIQTLKNNGVVVIYRVFHEMNGNWGFWWQPANFSTAQYKSLWIKLWNYFTNTKGLDNIIWVYSPNGGSSLLTWYPGDAYVDLVGFDYYTDNPSDAAGSYNSLVTQGKPVVYAEFGSGGPSGGNRNFDLRVLISALKNQMPKCVFWTNWWDGNGSNDGWGMDIVKFTNEALNDPYVLNRDTLNRVSMNTPYSAPGSSQVNVTRIYPGSGSITDSSGNIYTISSVNAPTGYTVEYKLSSSASYSGAANFTDAPASITGLQPSTTYNFRVYAMNTGGSGPVSAAVTATTTSASGPATTWNPNDKSANITLSNNNLTASSSGAFGQTVRATTGKSAGKQFFEVRLNTVSNNTSPGIATANFPMFDLLGNVPSSLGVYPVSPNPTSVYINNIQLVGGTSANAAGVTVSIALDLDGRLAWVSTNAMRNAGYSWNNNSSANPVSGVGGISLSQLDSGQVFPAWNDSDGNNNATLNTGASSFVVAVPSGYQAWDSATSSQNSPPNQVINLSASATSASQVDLTWDAPSGSPTGYTVQYKKQSDTSYSSMNPVQTTSASVSGLIASTQYNFRVFATNNFGNGALSSVVSATTPASGSAQLPGQPLSLQATGSTPSSVSLSWGTPSSGSSVVDYLTQYKITTASVWTDGPSTASTSAIVPNLTASQSYDFRVLARNSAGSGPVSNTVTKPTTAAGGGTRKYYDQPGSDDSYWNTPLKDGAVWSTASMPMTQSVRNPGAGGINTTNFGIAIWVADSNDPLVTVTTTGANYGRDWPFNPTMHIPAGAYSSGPYPGDNHLVVFDKSNPQKMWGFWAALRGGEKIQSNTTGIQAVAGEVDLTNGRMEDQETGQFGWNAGIGVIRHWELDPTTNPTMRIQHSLRYACSVTQLQNLDVGRSHNQDNWRDYTSIAPNGYPYIMWPGTRSDFDYGDYSGNLPVGATLGIPKDIPMPAGLSQGGQMLWWNAQNYGWNWRDQGGNAITLYAEPQDAGNQILQGMQQDFGKIVANLCVLLNQTGASSRKGVGNFLVSPPPSLDTGTTTPSGAISLATPSGVTASSVFAMSGTLSGFSSAPSLEYTDDGGAAQSITNTSSTPTTSFSFNHPSLTQGTHTVVVRVASSPSINSTVTFTVAAGAGESADQTVISAGSSAAIIDKNGNRWTITSGSQVAVNGTADTSTGSVTRLAYVTQQVWQENSAGLWWYKNSPSDSSWQPPAGTTSPLTAAPVAAPSLPKGIYHVSGNQIQDSANNNIRLNFAEWGGGNSTSPTLDGLNSAPWKELVDKFRPLGFNGFKLLCCTSAVLNDAAITGIDLSLNSDLSGKTYLGVLDAVIDYCDSAGIRVIVCMYNQTGVNVEQNSNGLWYGLSGITDANHVTAWQNLATRWKDKPAILGYDLLNQPLSKTSSDCTWESGSNNSTRNLRYMYERVGNAIHSIDSKPLIFCSGPLRNITSQNFANTGVAAPEGDLSLVQTLPVVLTTPNKVVYGVSSVPPTSGGGTGQFTVSNGKIYAPDGNEAVLRGVNIYSVNGAVTNDACQPLTTYLPNIAIIRLNTGKHSYPSVSSLKTAIDRLLAQNIVVAIEDHLFPQSDPLDGTTQAAQSAWYASFATAYKDNPFFWFMSTNEAGSDGRSSLITDNHVAIYNAIRNTGNNSIILFCVDRGGGPNRNANIFDASRYANMRNVGWDLHVYAWWYTRQDKSEETNQTVINNKNTQFINECRSVSSLDGPMPVFLGEYGDSTDGNTINSNWQQVLQGVFSSGLGSTAWNYDDLTPDPGDDVVRNGSLTVYGQQVKNHIQSGVKAQRGSGSTTNDTINRWNNNFGYIVKNGIAPVWVSQAGSKLTTAPASETDWAAIFTKYLNGTASNGPTFTSTQEKMSSCWREWHTGEIINGIDYGILTAWRNGSIRAEQSQYINALKPTLTIAAPSGGAPLITSPLSGSVSRGTWNYRDISARNISGGQFHYAILLPHGYSINNRYPIIVYEHQNTEGNSWYKNKGDPAQNTIVNQDVIDGVFNSVAFRTAYPSIVLIPYCDQTDDSGGSSGQNFGGYNDTAGQNANENAVAAMVQDVWQNFSCYKGKTFITGDSLGGHGTIASMLDWNAQNGPAGRVFTAGWSSSGQIALRSPNPSSDSATINRMRTVPLLCLSGSSDGTSPPENFNRPMWRNYASNSNYPQPPGAQAGSSSYRYAEDPNLGHNTWSGNGSGRNYRLLPDGKPFYDWLFSQTTPGAT